MTRQPPSHSYVCYANKLNKDRTATVCAALPEYSDRVICNACCSKVRVVSQQTAFVQYICTTLVIVCNWLSVIQSRHGIMAHFYRDALHGFVPNPIPGKLSGYLRHELISFCHLLTHSCAISGAYKQSERIL